MIQQYGTSFPADMLKALIEGCMAKASVNSNEVDRVCVASEEEYDAVRAAVSDGAAKPIPKEMKMRSEGWASARKVEDRISSVVVLPVDTVEKGLAGDARAVFTICHEMGHANDFAARSHLGLPAFPHDPPFRIAATRDFYVEKYAEEFAANFHAGPAATRDQLDFDLRHVGKFIAFCARQPRQSG